MIIQCDHCDVAFHRKPCEVGKHNFCSKQCMMAARRLDGGFAANPKNGSVILCKQCGKEFYVPKARLGRSKFCSAACRGKWHGEQHRGENATNFKGSIQISHCIICGREIRDYRERSYCSQECMGIHRRNEVSLECANCGTTFKRVKSAVEHTRSRRSANMFCSNNCRHEHQKKENHPSWKKDRSQLKSENRSLRYSAEMKDWRAKVFLRDNYTCGKCGKRGGRLNAHHIRLFATFKELRFDISNGITLCYDCHKEVRGREEEFVEIFQAKLKGQLLS